MKKKLPVKVLPIVSATSRPVAGGPIRVSACPPETSTAANTLAPLTPSRKKKLVLGRRWRAGGSGQS
jgi:hypothetical protein